MCLMKAEVRVIKYFIGLVALVAGFVGGLYVGGWVLFIQPIIELCKAFDANAVTAVMVGVTIIKCILAGTVGSLIFYLGAAIGKIIVEW